MEEGFNAFAAELMIEGYEVHPGDTYDVMEDPGYILSVFNASLPASRRPETTRENQGYILCTGMEGNLMKSHAKYILRSFSVEEMEFFKQLMNDQIECLKRKYVKSKFTLEFREQYRNPKRYIPDDVLTEKMSMAMRKVGIEPIRKYMRGGSDSSFLCEHGLPCIVMFAGGCNFHSRREFVPVHAINKGVEVLVELIQLF